MNSVSYLDGEYGTIACIKRDLSNIANSFINIGFRLYEADLNHYYLEKGYNSIYEMAAAEFDMKKSVVSRYINVYKRFHSLEGRQMDIRARYKNYNYSQLCEMLSLSDKDIEDLQINSDMPVSQIRYLKKNKNTCLGRCDVATTEKDSSKKSDVDISDKLHEPVDVECIEIDKKSFDDVYSFTDYIVNCCGDACTAPDDVLKSYIDFIVKNNTKSNISSAIIDWLVDAQEGYLKYLKSELGE